MLSDFMSVQAADVCLMPHMQSTCTAIHEESGSLDICQSPLQTERRWSFEDNDGLRGFE